MYDTDKLSSYPRVIENLKQGCTQTPITVHLMPQNLCNQRCNFCSYRMPDNKNSSHFYEFGFIPLEDLISLVMDFCEMGVQGIEVTGGGEPLAYPRPRQMWNVLKMSGIATSLVTNGTLLSRHLDSILDTNIKWVRVSIDAAEMDTYCMMRHSPKRHFYRAWEAVSLLADAKPHPDFKVGVGFVLSNENLHEVYPFVSRAWDAGADNVRLSLTFSDKHKAYFRDTDLVRIALDEADRATEDFNSDSFKVVNLMRTRWVEVLNPVQDYVRCPTKDVLCVIEGEGKVYTCCTFTGSSQGLYGRFQDHPRGFKGLWEDAHEWRRKFDASQYCKTPCLYRNRNLVMNSIIDNFESKLHREFI